MLNTLDKFNEENWDHSRKKEFIRSAIANMFHFFPFSEIKNVILRTAVSSRIIHMNVQQKSWTRINHMLKMPQELKISFISNIVDGLRRLDDFPYFYRTDFLDSKPMLNPATKFSPKIS